MYLIKEHSIIFLMSEEKFLWSGADRFQVNLSAFILQICVMKISPQSSEQAQSFTLYMNYMQLFFFGGVGGQGVRLHR